jgi:hypothetical protein
VRKLSGMLLVMLMALLLAACGSDDGDDDPTAVATVAGTEAADASPTVTPTEAALGIDEATPPTTAAGLATPATTGIGTPASVASPVVGATPVPAGTPAVIASPVAATPVPASGVAPAGDVATREEESARLVTLTGQVVLPGTENEAFVISDEGCVGLGADADMRAGRQLVVRDEAGTIIGVTTLEAAESDGCAWDFSLEVPESAFYAVSIPMKTEMIFTHDEIEEGGGEIAIPLR